MSVHATLSASGAHRWMECTPSALLEKEFKDETSIYAREGTAAHALAEHKLRLYMGEQSKRPTNEFDSLEMDKYTDQYVEYACELISAARARSKDTIVLIEQRLDFSEYVPEGFGTGDLVIVADGTLEVVDLKYGQGVEVSAEDNPQMKLYALGALALFDSLYDIQTVRMTICQPRRDHISEYAITTDELISWAETTLKRKAQMAIQGEGEFEAGDHCRFCRARFTCRERAACSLALAQYDFKQPALLNDEEISEILPQSDRIAKWAADVWVYATDTAINSGKHWSGFKLVEGRSNRKYTDDKKVAETVIQAGYTDIYKTSLIGISGMEKLLGKKKFRELVGNFVAKPQGKPTLVPITDKRPEMNIQNTAQADFKEELI